MTAAELLKIVVDRVHGRDRDDPYAWVRDATDDHRRQHGCWAYPYADGTLLGGVGAAAEPARVLELGTALGYTSCWWAASGAHVDTIEREPLHVQLARENIERADLQELVTVHPGDFNVVLSSLDGPFDLAFFDGYEPPADLLHQLATLLGANGLVVTTNLDLGQGETRSTLGSTPGWVTHFVADLALSVRS